MKRPVQGCEVYQVNNHILSCYSILANNMLSINVPAVFLCVLYSQCFAFCVRTFK
jgi:hypothetical protein